MFTGLRVACDSTFATAKSLVPEMLNLCPTKRIRAFFCKAWQYMDAYHQLVFRQCKVLNTNIWSSKGLNAKQAEFAVKKCHSHCQCGPSVMMSLGIFNNPL
jgi:hypothetical protein